MKKVSMMKKVISALLSACMIVSVLAAGVTVSAADGETGTETTAATEVYYSGQRLNSGTPYLLIGKATEAASTTVKASAQDNDSDGKWELLAQFDAQTGTLTFKSGRDITDNPWDVGMPLKQIDANGDEDASNDKYYGIYANGNLTIELGNYVNLLYLGRQEPKNFGQEGIHVEGDLTVNGGKKGLLRVTANPAGKQNGGLQSYGVYAKGNVILNGGTLDVYETTWHLKDTPFYLYQNYTTLIKASDVKLNGGSLYLRARNNDASPATNKTLHEIGAEKTDAITVPDSYNQQWAKEFEYSKKYTGEENDGENQERNKGNDGNTTFNTSKTDGDVYVKYTLADEKGFKIKVAGQELGGYEKYLHIGSDNTGVTANEDSTDAAAEYNITKNSDGTLTKELKFLKDTKLYYDVKGAGYVIGSDSDLVINTNGKSIEMYSAMKYEWPYTRTSCVRADGDLTITGGGSLKGRIEGEAVEDKENANDRSATAVIYSGGKLTFDDITAVLFIAKERANASIAKYPQSNVLYANQVVISESANLKLRKSIAPTDNDAAGLLIAGTNDISVPAAADSFTGNIEIDNANAYDWKGALRSGDKLYDYSYDKMKTSTYMEVSTADTTVAISSVSVNDGETVSDTANTVKFIPTAANAEEAPQIFVLAKACDENGVLTSAAIYSGAADGAEHILTLGGGESVKLYVWNAADGLKPLKKVRTYYAAETAAE